MPFLRDEGPPVSKDTIQRARESLPLEYGCQVVNETGREVLLVRVPKAKPDYLHDLGDVAFYVNLDAVRNCKDVLLIGHEKTARVEPQLLRDNIRAQDREDADLVSDLRRRLGRDYGQTILQSPSNFQHQALAVRIPKGTIAEFSPDDVRAIRDVVQQQGSRFQHCQYAYVVADRDHERLGHRMLLELIGVPTAAGAPPPPAAPLAPAAPPSASIAQRVALPPTPGSTPLATPAAAAPEGGTLPSFLAAKVHQPPAAPAAPPASAPAAAPAAAPSSAPAAAPAASAPPTPVPPAAVEVSEHEEYAIITRRPAPLPAATSAAAPAAASAPAEPPAAASGVEAEYEITAKPRPAAPPAPAGVPAAAEPEPERNVSRATEEFEVYSSKPKPKAPGPAITPPGQGGFQAALDAAASLGGGHAPSRTKEYEIMGGRSEPTPVARALARPAAPAVVDDPRVVAPLPARAPAAPLAAPQDNGVTIVPKVQAAAPEQALALRFRENGYEVVESLRASGTVFAFAAHKQGGRRVLLKRAAEFGPDEAATLAQLVAALGADICLVVADRVAPGTRLATWGTRIEAYTPPEASALAF
jgi:hypothetical protein